MDHVLQYFYFSPLRQICRWLQVRFQVEVARRVTITHSALQCHRSPLRVRELTRTVGIKTQENTSLRTTVGSVCEKGLPPFPKVIYKMSLKWQRCHSKLSNKQNAARPYHRFLTAAFTFVFFSDLFPF